MKKFIYLSALSLFAFQSIKAQNVPQGMNYQAILQDSKGPISNKAVDLKLTILDGSNNIMYQETFSKYTEMNGGINTVIGTGSVQSGTFSGINWGAGDRYLKVEVNVNGTGYQAYGSNVKFQSVPYALYSLNPGPKGDKGDAGAAGTAGTAGAAGTPGKDGATGKDGVAGKDGVDGKDGATGASGSANMSGTKNYMVKFTGTTSGGKSIVYDSSSAVSIGTTTPRQYHKFSVNTTGENYSAINGITTGNFSSIFGEADGGSGFGVYGINKATDGTGIIGSGNALTPFKLTAGSGAAFTGTNYGVFGLATSTTTGIYRAGGYFQDNGSGSYALVGAITNAGTSRKIEGNGTVNTVVKDVNGKKILLSAIETPENLFTDYGAGQLQNGRAHINLDPNFAKNIIVNEKHPLRVFVQLEGDCKGVYVSNKSGLGFDVIELVQGNSNVKFSYTVVANRADEVLLDGTVSKYSDERFAPAMGLQPIQSISNK